MGLPELKGVGAVRGPSWLGGLAELVATVPTCLRGQAWPFHLLARLPPIPLGLQVGWMGQKDVWILTDAKSQLQGDMDEMSGPRAGAGALPRGMDL